jgi:UDP-3-O-[3-hydroxymyristoyl] glucosamine N-acyltransferase
MIDSRFFNKKEYVTMKEICDRLSIEVPNNCDPSKKITNIAGLDNATDSDITFFHNPKYLNDLKHTRAFACLISAEHKDLAEYSAIPLVVSKPYLSLSLLLSLFYSTKDKRESFISDKASISKVAVIEGGCHISDFVSIGDGCLIKKGTFIGPNTSILHGVQIGENCHIESNVTIGFSVIGDDVYIKSGARIGQQGFGFHADTTGITDILQIGIVIIGNNTQIGANCTIDRGSMNNTKIGSHARIDNMVHIAHNVEIGDYCVMAAQTGIAGSTKIGNACVFGGQVGIAGHLKIGDKVTVAAQSGIMRNANSGAKIAGSPAINSMSWHRQNVILQKLVENRKETEC